MTIHNNVNVWILSYENLIIHILNAIIVKLTYPDKMQSLYTNLKKLRLTRHLSQTQMGDLMNISAAQYSKIENGRCHINLHHLEALAHNLGISFVLLYSKLKETEACVSLSNLKIQQAICSDVHFEHAIDALRAYCIKNSHLITIQLNGDITVKAQKEMLSPM